MIPRVFIFEGIDGCGKTTQCNNLKEYINKKGTECIIAREPGFTKIGEYIRNWLKTDGTLSAEHQLLLFCLARKQLCKEILDIILNTNKTVILDRFVLSTYAYQGIKLDESTINDYLLNICPEYSSILSMAKTIYLDIDPKNSYNRIHSRGEQTDSFESLDMLQKVHDLYSKYIDPKKHWIIDANQCVENVWLQIVSKL